MRRNSYYLLPLLFAAAAAARADYVLVLPLQYNAYQPASARALAAGNCWAVQAGLAALFANPAELPATPGLMAQVAGSAMSCFISRRWPCSAPARKWNLRATFSR